MSIDALAPVMGSILILAGIGQVIFQMLRSPRGMNNPHRQGAEFDRSGFKVQTAYPGITMICVGALLLLAGTSFR